MGNPFSRLLDKAGDAYYKTGRKAREFAKAKIVNSGSWACEKLGDVMGAQLTKKCKRTGKFLVDKGENLYNVAGKKTGVFLGNVLRPVVKKADRIVPDASPVLKGIPENEIPKLLASAVKKALVSLGANPEYVKEDVNVNTDRLVKLKNFERYENLFKKAHRFDMMQKTFTAKESDFIDKKNGLVLKYYPSRGGLVAIVHPTYTPGHLKEVVLEISDWRNMHRKNLDAYLSNNK